MKQLPIFSLLVATFLFVGCSGDSSDDEVVEDTAEEVTEEETTEEETGEESSGEIEVFSVDTSLFSVGALVSPDTVDCTLSNGETTSCYQ